MTPIFIGRLSPHLQGFTPSKRPFHKGLFNIFLINLQRHLSGVVAPPKIYYLMYSPVFSKPPIFKYLLFTLFLISCGEKPKEGNSSMFLGDKEHTGNYDSPSVKSEPEILWKFETGGQVISSPVIFDNTVYIGSSDNNLYAINAGSGKVLWKYETGGAVNSTPLVTKDKVMFLSYDGVFYALNRENGKPVWRFKTQGESRFLVKDYFNRSFKPDFWDFYLSSPVVKGNKVYFGSSDSNIYALELETGDKIWSYKTGGSVHSSPALSGNSLVTGSWDSNVYCVDASSGKEKWKFETGKDLESYIWLGVQASPTIDNGTVYIGSRDAKFYALNLENGKPIWITDEFNRSWMPSSAAVGSENIYTGSSDSFSFFSIDRKSGDINYAVDTKAYTFSSPAIDREMAYIGSANGRLYGIELTSGDIKWEFETIGAITDTIQLFDDTGRIDKVRYKELTKDIRDMPALSTLMEKIFSSTGAILSSPVISDRVIYFGSSDGNVYAITDKK